MILEQLPTLMDAALLDRYDKRIGTVVDFLFEPATGAIRHYLIARSDPRLPGTSRWRLSPDRIQDQQVGAVSTALQTLDDLPLARSSVRQDLLQRTQRWRDQLRDMGDRAGDRLEGWLEDVPWDEQDEERRVEVRRSGAKEVWDDDEWPDRPRQRDEDPWV